MCDVMTICELKKYYEKHKPTAIYFATSDQSWYEPSLSVSIKLVFSQMIVQQDINLVVMKNGKEQMMLYDVVSAYREYVADDCPGLGDILTITGHDHDGREMSLRFLVF